ncbi:serine carboxypeptidase [Striga asiatica]|uniref:Carboxypeptidase n=1 Tax=Striga asiatica TaxID=4170 RepID=A0A5A7QAJ9_STRAF|nr:serine carboxypeptidase [Striga asiatica]
MKLLSFIFFTILCLTTFSNCYDERGQHPLQMLLRSKILSQHQYLPDVDLSIEQSEVYVACQKGKKEADKIEELPGQPSVNFSQYSGYVTVDPKAERALFYYFTESEDPENTPLVLWLNGGPGCSSLGAGAMSELGPFRVNRDRNTLQCNEYAWNKVANVLFLESPAGVGFSYSNRTSDYVTGDAKTAKDTYVFLVNWLERFSDYKNRALYLAGESYAGHYVPQLASLILDHNKIKKPTILHLKGIIIGNADIDESDWHTGTYDYLRTHALIPYETHKGIIQNCNFFFNTKFSSACISYIRMVDEQIGNINLYNIYAHLCNLSSSAPLQMSNSDPCLIKYVSTYLNKLEVQKSLHVNLIEGKPRPWSECSKTVNSNWTGTAITILPIIKKLIAKDVRVWIYSGDVDSAVSVTSTKLSLNKINASIQVPWYPWHTYGDDEVAGYAVGYKKHLTFATVRASGHLVPRDQPKNALTLFASFLEGKLPPEKKQEIV